MDAATQVPVVVKSPAVGHRVPRRAFVLLGLLAVATAGWWYFTQFAAPTSRGIVASGTIESEEVSIAAELPGRVVQLLVEEGDRVRAGDVLVKLDDSLQQLQLRMSPMSERQLQELQLSKMTLRSPMDGIVARRSIRVGEMASPGSTLMAVTRPDP
ncbi:MAG: biotin/lipoyl-binding protein, partial [Chloroflexota bacterium]